MSKCVLDASALLAFVLGENGHQVVEDALPDAVMSAVNVEEVVSTLADRGYAAMVIRLALDQAAVDVVPFSVRTANASGLLRPATRSAGLSLGDRACLALAIELGLPALTADRAWAGVRTKAKVELIR